MTQNLNFLRKQLSQDNGNTNLSNDPRLLQQILIDLGALNGTFLVKVNVNVFAESTRVVISDCFGIAECCQQTTVWRNGRILQYKISKRKSVKAKKGRSMWFLIVLLKIVISTNKSRGKTRFHFCGFNYCLFAVLLFPAKLLKNCSVWQSYPKANLQPKPNWVSASGNIMVLDISDVKTYIAKLFTVNQKLMEYEIY